MKKTTWTVLAAIMCSLFAGCAQREVVVERPAPPPPPPAPIVEVRGVAPYPGAVWMPGVWVWRHHRRVWVHGYWRHRY